jgi:hypothetical protein
MRGVLLYLSPPSFRNLTYHNFLSNSIFLFLLTIHYNSGPASPFCLVALPLHTSVVRTHCPSQPICLLPISHKGCSGIPIHNHRSIILCKSPPQVTTVVFGQQASTVSISPDIVILSIPKILPSTTTSTLPIPTQHYLVQPPVP